MTILELKPMAAVSSPRVRQRARFRMETSTELLAAAPNPLANDGAHPDVAIQGRNSPVVGDLTCESQWTYETQKKVALARDDGAHVSSANLPWTSPVVAQIIQLWRMRQRWHRAEKALTLQALAICRAWTSGDKEAAAALFGRAAKGDCEPQLAQAIAPFLSAIAEFKPLRAGIEKTLRKLARDTPLWPWAKDVRGFGDLNLAAILGESGYEIASFRNPSCLWKRFGLAVIDGGRQRRVTDAEQALRHGYNPSRRAVAFLLGECLIKGKSAYKAIYDARKLQELERDGMTKLHAHRRAARFMVKRVLLDLWVEASRAARLPTAPAAAAPPAGAPGRRPRSAGTAAPITRAYRLWPCLQE